MSYVKFDDSRIYFEFIEKDTASQTVALLHGNAASSKMFAPILKLYTKKYSVLLIDFLGYGKSNRINHIPVNIWHYESKQLIHVIESKCKCRELTPIYC